MVRKLVMRVVPRSFAGWFGWGSFAVLLGYVIWGSKPEYLAGSVAMAIIGAVVTYALVRVTLGLFDEGVLGWTKRKPPEPAFPLRRRPPTDEP